MKANKQLILIFIFFICTFIFYRLFFVARHVNYVDYGKYKIITNEMEKKLLASGLVESVLIYESNDDIPVPFYPEAFSLKIVLNNKMSIDLTGVKRDLKFRKKYGGIKSFNELMFCCVGNKEYLNYIPLKYLSLFINKEYEDVLDVIRDFGSISAFCENLNFSYTYYCLRENMTISDYERTKKNIGHYVNKNGKDELWLYKSYAYEKQ